MTRLFGRLLLAAWMLHAAAVPAAEKPADLPSAAHRAALDAYRAAHVRAHLDAAPEPLRPYWADGLRLMPGYQLTVLGAADAATYHRAFVERFAVRTYTRQPIESVDLGAWVMEMGRFTMTVAPRGSAASHALAGKYMDLWQKSGSGMRLATAAWNYDELPAIAQQLRFAEVPAVHMALQARLPVRAGIGLELAALGRLQETAIAQHDGATWALFFADDAIQLSNHGDVVSGRAALDAYMAAHAQALPVFEKLDLRTDRIDDLGRFVVEYASGVAVWRMNDASGVSLGKNIRIWRRAGNGVLQIWRAISMYD